MTYNEWDTLLTLLMSSGAIHSIGTGSRMAPPPEVWYQEWWTGSIHEMRTRIPQYYPSGVLDGLTADISAWEDFKA